MTALSWHEIIERAARNNKTLFFEVDKRGKYRYFRVRCDICYDVKDIKIDRFSGCAVCHINKRVSNTEEFILKARLIHGDKFNYDLVEFVDSLSKVIIKCNTCNHVFTQKAYYHLRGYGCLNCVNDSKRSNIEEFAIKAVKVHGYKYNYDSSVYLGALIKIKILCTDCNNYFMQRPTDHLYGRGCPICNESKGELKVAKYLSDHGIEFIRQHTFDSLRNINPLKVDFYIPKYSLIIEYDGEGHYKPTFGSTIEEKQKCLDDIQRNDKIKDSWVLNNNILLLRIPYWDYDNIEELIEKFILEI